MPANWANQTIWTGDNLPILRGLNSESVDLIYLDPPFNSKVDYAAPIGSKAAGAAFKDTWTLSDLDVEWINLIEEKYPALYRVLLATLTDSDKSYLIFMSARLLEMKRVLKDTGSIYLHCDPTMSHYLKLVMDVIFERTNFRNEIVWKRTYAHGGADKWGSVHDTLLMYSKSDSCKWTGMTQEYSAEYLDDRYSKTDERGRYQEIVMTGPGVSDGPSGKPWRGYDPTKAGRHWAVPRAALKALAGDGVSIPDALHARLELLYEHGFIYIPNKPGGVPRFKRHVTESQGLPVQDVIADIPPINSQAAERTGYPTQKPIALLDRIIQASSNPGDMVIDPFCGCATTLVAADGLKRKWVGIDISEKAADLVVKRVHEAQGLWRKIIHRKDLPQRTDLGDIPTYNCPANRHNLYGVQEGHCAGCKTHFEARHLEVDHIISRAKGGTDHIDNLQLLCGNCNRIKGDRGMEYLKAKLQIR